VAGPTIGAIGARLSASSTTSASVAVPSDVAADSVIVVMLSRSALDDSYRTLTLPSGFALVPDNPGGTTGAGGAFKALDVAWKRATGNDAGTYDFSWSGSNQFRTAFALRIDGCRTAGNPFEADDGAVGTGDVVVTPAVSVTTTGADRLLLWGAGSWDSGAWTMPTGFTQQVSDAPFDLVTCGTKAQAVAGGSGSLVGSQPGNSTRAAWVGAFVAPPAVSGTAAAPLGGLTATATGTPTVLGTASAALGALTAIAYGPPPPGRWHAGTPTRTGRWHAGPPT
jgi:hypothetical protein